MRTKILSVVAAAALLAAAVPALAHHSFAAEFDAKKPVKLQGTVTKMEWINPHSWIHIDVKKPDGKVESWMVEAGAPNALLRRGFNKQSLLPGTVILTGTPHGVGMARKPPRWLKEGDSVTIEIEKIGQLTNPVVNEP